MTNALKPIGYGKKILSVEEALKGLEGYQPPAAPPGATTPDSEVKGVEPTTSDPATNNSYFVKPGRFSVGGIKQVGEDFVFYDVELPMGSWKELTLKGKLFHGKSRDFNDWAKVTASSQPTGVMPADIRYGLMTICYLKQKTSKLKDIITTIHTDILIPDAKTHYPHNATRIDYIANQQAQILVGAGWHSTHPFCVSYQASIAGPHLVIGKQEAVADTTLTPALEGLLGENDPDRVKKVIEWSMNKTPAKLWRLNTTESDKRVVVFGVSSDDYAGIDASGYDYDLWPARGVNADAKNFCKK